MTQVIIYIYIYDNNGCDIVYEVLQIMLLTQLNTLFNNCDNSTDNYSNIDMIVCIMFIIITTNNAMLYNIMIALYNHTIKQSSSCDNVYITY